MPSLVTRPRTRPNRRAIDRARWHRQKGKLGANAILGVSRGNGAGRGRGAGLPLYTLCRRVGRPPARADDDILNGRAQADNPIDSGIQVMPVGAPDFAEGAALRGGDFHALKSGLAPRGLSTAVGDEGGFAPNIASARAALDLVGEATQAAGYNLGRRS